MRVLLTALALLALSVPAWSYPTSGSTPDLNQGSYLSFPSPKENINDLIFYGKADKPSYAALTTTEKLMVGGGVMVPGQPRLRPYYEYVFEMAAQYYEETGTIPAVLDPDTIKKLPHVAKMSPALQQQLDLEKLRNPLTGNWPRLDARTLSPGDFYIRALSADEMRYLAKFDSDDAKMWFQGTMPDGNGNLTQQGKLGCALYVRMYGLQGPLMATLMTSGWS